MKHSRVGSRAFLTCAVATAALLAVAGPCAAWSDKPSSVVSVLLLAFAPYGGLLLIDPRGARLSTALALTAIAGVAMALSQSPLSDDVYRYLWDGRVLLSGVDPYAHTPDAPALSHLRDERFSRINHRDLATVYPPLSQLYFALGAASGSIAGLKIVALCCHLASVALVAVVAGELGVPGSEARRGGYLLALNPLALSEAALGGHVDAAVGLSVLVCALFLGRGRAGAAAAAIGAASGLKLVGLALWPLLIRRNPRAASAALAIGLVCLWPLLSAGEASSETQVAGLSHYAQRWRGNEGAFAVVELATGELVDATAGRAGSRDVGPQQIEVAALRGVLARLEGGALDPQAAVRGEHKQAHDPAVFDRAHLSGLLARMLCATVVLGLSLYLGARRAQGALAVRAVLLAGLLLAPQLHPWYLLWLLPLELALGKRVALIWSAAIFAAYAPLDAWLAHRTWHEPLAAQLVEYGLVAGALVAELAAARSQRSSSQGPVPLPGA